MLNGVGPLVQHDGHNLPGRAERGEAQRTGSNVEGRGHGNERLRSLASGQSDGYKRDRSPEATRYRHRALPFPPRCMGRLLESAAGRAFSIGEIPWHETRRGGAPHGGGLSGRSRALTTRYHVHGTAVGRARGARVALDGPCSPDHRGRPIGADPARRRERRLGRRDHARAGARAAVARRAGARPAPLPARRQPVRRGGAGRGPRSRRDRRHRRGGVSSHRRSGRAVRLARRLVRYTREGARAVAGRGSDAGAALVPGVGRRPGGDAPPRRRTSSLRPRRPPHLREAWRPGVPHPVRRRHRAHEPVHAVPGAPSGAASRRARLRDVGDTRRARGGARAAAAGRYAGVRAAARRLRSYCEIVREYPVSGRSWKSDPATASMVATYWLSFRVSATPIVTTAPFVSVPVTANRVTIVRGWEKTRSPAAAVMLVGASGPVNLN